MKKLTLLCLTTILVIGIQSCSTEEIGIEENTVLENIKLNKAKSFNQNEKNILGEVSLTVLYPESMDEATRNKFRILMRQNVFDTLLTSLEQSCEASDLWFVTGYDKDLAKEAGIVLPAGVRVAEVITNEEDETIANIGTYRHKIGPFFYKIRIVQERPQLCPNVNDNILLEQK